MTPYDKMIKKQNFLNRLCGQDLRGNKVKEKEDLEPLEELENKFNI